MEEDEAVDDGEADPEAAVLDDDGDLAVAGLIGREGDVAAVAAPSTTRASTWPVRIRAQSVLRLLQPPTQQRFSAIEGLEICG